ncbi:unnamed protein product [Adineta ricciae]|uniref:Uncharacterized protein n=1 Tax=Adineta ricciae TaxID=249248 RepID=A0A815W6H6_ADIRI|nr:unnamed protein product [Adineta ricciae]CAF1625271.1 unnamed protein product [Adineta ricciae]
MCLTWHDVCNRKIDCLNNIIDEKDCFELELNQCDGMKKFRCYNEQCIPLELFNDNSQFPDFLDRFDELFHTSLSCYTEPSMRCEDHRCKFDSINTNWGNGDCHDIDCPNGQTER